MSALTYPAFIARERIRAYTAKLQQRGDYHHLDHAARNIAGVVIQAQFRALPIPPHRALTNISKEQKA